MVLVPSYTYAGGVLSRGLYGRVDLNKYQTGLKAAHNMYVDAEGGVFKRPGMYLVGLRKHTDKRSKLFPWRIGVDDSYMLEFAEGAVRFIRFGGYITIPDGHVPAVGSTAVNVGDVMEVPSPYLASEVSEIKFTFANDIMYLYHKNHPVQQLVRMGLYDWKMETVNFDPHPNWSGTVTATWNNTTTTEDNYDPEPVPTSYMVSATLADGTETKPSSIVTVNADTGHRRCWVSLSWPAYAGAVQYTIYKGKNGIFGFIGYTTATSYDDRNYAPSYDVVPLREAVSFGAAGQYPAVGEFYKQRMAFGQTPLKKQNLWLSRPYLFNSLRKSVPLQDDDAFELPLVGRQRHTINHLLQLKKFLIFTDTSEWVLNTVEGKALSFASADPTIETSYGCHPRLRPTVIGSRILFIQNKTQAILDLGYEYTSDAFIADDLTRLARGLFKNKTIMEADYAVDPHNIYTCVLDDGSFNIMTYVRQHEIWGWTTGDTRGKVTDFAAVEEPNGYGCYYQVEREVNGQTYYFIERSEIVLTSDIEDQFHVDCGLTYRNELTATFLNYVDNSHMVVSIPGHELTVGKQLLLRPDGVKKFYAEVTDIDDSVVTVKILHQLALPLGLEGVFPALVCATTITNLDHLDGTEIWVLADGKVYKELTVASGELTLPYPAAIVHVGLPYSTYMETLDLDFNEAAGQYRPRSVNEITINLENSRGVYVGASQPNEELYLIKPRSSSDNMYNANAPLDGPYIIPAHTAWELTCGVRVESRDPLPLKVLNIVPDINYGY